MKLSRLVALLTGLAFALPAAPAQAADPGLTLTINQRWEVSPQAGAWTPYTVTLKNDGAADFTGDVLLVPNQASRTQGPPSNSYPTYRARLAVPRATARSLTIYVIEASSGYGAEVRDLGGHVVGSADVQSTARAQAATALLSDVQQGDQKISALRPLPRGFDFSMTRFASAQAFPTNAVYLSGLSAIVIDQFDSASLSQAQLQALRDFVGLGGSLVLAGGSTWRRTLLPLPAELTPMRPEASGTGSIDPLTQLAGKATSLVVPTVTGALRQGRAVVGAPDGSPLIVEGNYGAGRIVELAVDPFADPIDPQPSLAGIIWSQALSRALLISGQGSRGTLGASGFGTGPKPMLLASTAGGGAVAVAPGSFVPGYGGVMGPDVIFNLLGDAPAGTLPPIGLLGGLLVAYVLLAGILNYMALKAVHRRELMWVTVPLVALAFTGGSYWVGSSSRGTDFFDNEVQIQRLAPGGAVETYAYHGIFAPHRGDYNVRIPANTLASTALGLGGFGVSVDNTEIAVGQREQVELRGVAVWSMKTVQTLSVGHPGGLGVTDAGAAAGLDAHLALKGGRLQGTILNHTARPIQDLRAVTASGQEAVLAKGALNPGQTVSVDASLDASLPVNPKVGVGQAAPPPGVVYGGQVYNGDKRETVVRLAAAEALSGRQGELALVGVTDASSTLQIEGAQPAHSTLAAVVQPVQVESVDSLAAVAARPRIVSMVSDNAYTVDVYDIEVPTGVAASELALSYFYPPQTGQPIAKAPVMSVDVYDWTVGSWRAMPQFPATGRGLSSPVAPAEAQGGIIRVRVEELTPQSAQVAVTVPSGAVP